jgi:ComF family protein
MLSSVLDLLVPPRCLLCGRLQPAGGAGRGFCPACESALPRVPAGWVVPLGPTACAAPFYYEGTVREALHRFKFQGLRAMARPLAAAMTDAAGHLPPGQWDAVTWVPVSPRRRRERGYDHALLLARATAARLGLRPVRTLRKVRHTISQNKLAGDAAARAENVRGAFAADGAARGRRWLLVDDILTSGATLRACTDALYAAGAAGVFCLTAAKARRLREVRWP